MSWTKLHDEEWLYGSIRKYPPEIRALWPDLQAQASVSVFTGRVCVSPNIGYTKEQLTKMFNCTLEILEKSLTIFTAEKYIKIDENNVITLIDWDFYQSEYQRLKKYRKGTKKGTEKSTKKSCINAVSDSVSVSDSDSESNSDIDNDNTIDYAPDSPGYRISKKTWIKIKESGTLMKCPDLQKWAQEMKKIHDIDNLSWDMIDQIMTNARNDTFWEKNIRSPKSLRKNILNGNLDKFRPLPEKCISDEEYQINITAAVNKEISEKLKN